MITAFWKDHRFLSNFYPCVIEYKGLHYQSVEHAYVASKTKEPEERLIISQIETPGKAKRYGRKLELRADWSDILKFSIMRQLVMKKFQDKELRQLLLDTGDAKLIEGNNWGDRFWGAELVNGEWIGKNNLGKILNEIRNEIIMYGV